MAKSSTGTPVKLYLVLYNTLSALGWSYVLYNLVLHLATSNHVPPRTATHFLSSFLQTHSVPIASSYHAAPSWLTSLPIWPYISQFQKSSLYTRASTSYISVGPLVALVQSCAALEVLHALLGWVRSPVGTTAAQVASRLFTVWCVVEKFDVTRSSPLFTSMIFAWSTTEIIRYTYYALSLLNIEPYFLLYLRYTTFYALYPIGASSEAFLNYMTLPASSPIPSTEGWLLGAQIWSVFDYVRGACFVIWWPALYVLYTYMMSQRRRVLGKGPGRTLGAKPKRKLA